MPVSGLVVTLAPDPELRRLAVELLAGDPRMTLGELVEGHLPLVTETATLDEHEAIWKELEATAGVLQVRLAFHDFSDIDEFPRRPRTRTDQVEADREPT